jgi:Kef-type K+ transport system membrane component KefB
VPVALDKEFLPAAVIGRKRLALSYATLVLIPLIVVGAILRSGGGVAAPVGSAAHAAEGSAGIPLLLAQIGIIIALSRAVGAAIERVGQPRVIGEMLAGILLGPSFLGRALPDVAQRLFPANGFGALNALSQLGLVLFLFLVGMQINLGEARRHWRMAMLTSHASIAAPMACGAGLALFLYPRMAEAGVGFAGFALFIGVSMSITAFPVLARILSERGLLGTQLGSIAIACAAVDDVTGWCVLAGVVAIVRASHAAVPAWLPIVGLPCFLAAMAWGVRPLLRIVGREFAARQELSNDRKALLMALLLGSALTTEALGVHLLFGAFVLGTAMPNVRGLTAYVSGQFESLTVLLLLPLFFAYTGLRTRIGEIGGVGQWGVCLLIVAVAVAGKLAGTGIAARLGGLGWRQALTLGALMNTRGLMELVVLNIGLDVGLISPRLFSMMVAMAIVTTMMTPPMLGRLYPENVARRGVGLYTGERASELGA